MRTQALALRQLVSAHFGPRLSAVIPALAGPFYMVGQNRVVCENTFFVDWGIPPSRANLSLMRYVSRPDDFYGHQDGQILWRCYGSMNHPHGMDVHYAARERGFQIIDSTEFHSWLTKHTLNYHRLPANAGSLALEALLLKRLSQSPTPAASPAEKAQ
jgi:hypothetical protein